LQKAFDAYRDNKTRHEPLIFARETNGCGWTVCSVSWNLSPNTTVQRTIETMWLSRLTAAAVLATSLGMLSSRAPDLGEQIYQEGILPDGRLLSARVIGDVELRGSGAACTSCHRRSGYGLTDSEIVAPPVTGPALFTDRRPNRAELLSGLYQEVHAPRSWAEERVPKVRPAGDPGWVRSRRQSVVV
jgi:hypothetical protein